MQTRSVSPFRAVTAICLGGIACGLLAILLGLLYFAGVTGDVREVIYALAIASTTCTVTSAVMSAVALLRAE